MFYKVILLSACVLYARISAGNIEDPPDSIVKAEILDTDSAAIYQLRESPYLLDNYPVFKLPSFDASLTGSSMDWVDLSSGNLMIIEPLVHYKGRNGLDLDIVLKYNSCVWTNSYSVFGESIIPIYKTWCGLGWDFCMGELKLGEWDGDFIPEGSSIEIPNESINSRVIRGKHSSGGSSSIYYRIENNPAWNIIANPEPNGEGYIVISPSGIKYYFERWMDSDWGHLKKKTYFLTKIEDGNGNYMTITYWKQSYQPDIGYIGSEVWEDGPLPYYTSTAVYYYNRVITQIRDTKDKPIDFYFHFANAYYGQAPLLDSVGYWGFDTLGNPSMNRVVFEYGFHDILHGGSNHNNEAHLLNSITYRTSSGIKIKPAKMFSYHTDYGHMQYIWYPTHTYGYGPQSNGSGFKRFTFTTVTGLGMQFRRIRYTHEWCWGGNAKASVYSYGNNSEGNQGWDNDDITNSTILKGNIFIAPPFNLYVFTPGQYRKTMVQNVETGDYDIYYFLDEDDIGSSESFYYRQPLWGTCWKIERYNSNGYRINKEEYGYDLTVVGENHTCYGVVPWGYRQLRGEFRDIGIGYATYTGYRYNFLNQWTAKRDFGFVTDFSWGSYFSDPTFNIAPGWDNRRMLSRIYKWQFDSHYTEGKVWMVDRPIIDELYNDTTTTANLVYKIVYEYDTPNYNNYYTYSNDPPIHHITQGQYRGNLTILEEHFQEGGQWYEKILSQYKYDVCGNMVRSIDPFDHEISYRYDEDFGTESSGNPDVYQYAYLRKIVKYVNSDSICEGIRWFYPQGLISHHYGPNSTQPEHSWSFKYCRLNKLESIHAPVDNSTYSYPIKQYRYRYFIPDPWVGVDYHNHLITEAIRDDQINPNDPSNRFTDRYHYLDFFGRLFQSSRDNPYSEDSTWNVNYYYNENGMIDTVAQQFSSIRGTYAFMPNPGPMVKGFTQTLYDAIGRDTTITYPPGINEQDRIHYSNIDNHVTVTDENDNQRKYTYDAYGHLSKVEMIPGNSEYTTEYQYDALGNLIQLSKNNGQYIITYLYDSMGRLIQKNDRNSGITNYIYDDVGNLRFIQDANHAAGGDWVYYKYDDINRLIEEGEIYDVSPTRSDANNQNYPTNCSWRSKRYYDISYNGSTNPKGNFVREMISQDGEVCIYMSVYSYDKRGRLTSKTAYKSDSPIHGLTISYEYDAQDNLIKITYPDDEATKFHLNGLMMCDTVYNAADEMLAEIHYDVNEKPDSITFRCLSGLSYSYYPRDWVDNIFHDDILIRDYNNYDNVGNLLNEVREDYSIAYTYDNIYRLENELYSGIINKSISYTYNYLQDRIQLIEDEIPVQYSYTRGTSLLKNVGGNLCINDANGNQISYNGYTNTYNYRNELIERNGGRRTLYSYDGRGNRVEQETEGVKGTYRFYICDESGRVIFETDDTPNILRNPNFNNGTDWSPWLTHTPSGSCTWNVVNDAMKGGLYSIKGTTKTDNWETFIQKIQIADCQIPFVISVFVKTQDLTNGIDLQVDFYDGTNFLGNKQSGLVTGTNDWLKIILPVDNEEIPAGTAQMDIFVRKYAGTGTVWVDCFRVEGGSNSTPNDVKYIYMNSTHLAKIDAYGDPYFYLCDALGTPMKIVDKQSNIVKEETFKTFGEQLTSTGSFNNTHRFTGKEYEENDIYYFGARYYDPTIGRFLTLDPANSLKKENPLTTNPFVYCLNNPLKYIDPDGMDVYVSSELRGRVATLYKGSETFRRFHDFLRSDRNMQVYLKPRSMEEYGKTNFVGLHNGKKVVFVYINNSTDFSSLEKILIGLSKIGHEYDHVADIANPEITDKKSYTRYLESADNEIIIPKGTDHGVKKYCTLSAQITEKDILNELKTSEPIDVEDDEIFNHYIE